MVKILIALTPAGLSLMLLAAHFFRAQQVLLAALALGLVLMMVWRRPWVLRVVQAALLLGALEWLRTLWMLVMERSAMGQPYVRLAVILGLVAASGLGACLVLQLPRIQRHYRSGRANAGAGEAG